MFNTDAMARALIIEAFENRMELHLAHIYGDAEVSFIDGDGEEKEFVGVHILGNLKSDLWLMDYDPYYDKLSKVSGYEDYIEKYGEGDLMALFEESLGCVEKHVRGFFSMFGVGFDGEVNVRYAKGFKDWLNAHWDAINREAHEQHYHFDYKDYFRVSFYEDMADEVEE